MKAAILGALLLAQSGGCEQAPDGSRPVRDVPRHEVEGARFTVKSEGTFNAGNGNGNPREILIITDTRTGRQYLGVTGVGVAELVLIPPTTTGSE